MADERRQTSGSRPRNLFWLYYYEAISKEEFDRRMAQCRESEAAQASLPLAVTKACAECRARAESGRYIAGITRPAGMHSGRAISLMGRFFTWLLK